MKTILFQKSLFRAFLLLGLLSSLNLKVNAQVLCQFSYTNNSDCPINICADGGWDCKGNDGIPESMVPPVCTGVLEKGKTGYLCFDVTPREGCTFIITNYRFYSGNNSVELTQQQSDLFTAFLNSDAGGQYSLPISFESPENGCLGTLLFTNNGDGSISISNNDCPKICFRNETGCPISISLLSEMGGYTVNCNPAQTELYVTASLDLCDGCPNGNEACFSFPKTPEGCQVCVKLSDLKITVCPQDPSLATADYCTGVTINQGGQGKIKCSNGSEVNIAIILVNGVYVVRKI